MGSNRRIIHARMDAASQYDRAQISTRGFDPCHHEQQRLNFGHIRLRSPPGDSQMARLEGVEETSVMAHLSGAPVSGSRLLLCESAYPLEQLLLDLVGHRPCARARRHTECSVPAVSNRWEVKWCALASLSREWQP